MNKTGNIKARFLAAIGHVIPAGQSPAEAFSRLQMTNPDAFPVPRQWESLLAACAEVADRHEASK